MYAIRSYYECIAVRLDEALLLNKSLAAAYYLKEDLIYPMFSAFGENIKKEIPSMPGIYQQSIEHIVAEAKEVYELGMRAGTSNVPYIVGFAEAFRLAAEEREASYNFV